MTRIQRMKGEQSNYKEPQQFTRRSPWIPTNASGFLFRAARACSYPPSHFHLSAHSCLFVARSPLLLIRCIRAIRGSILTFMSFFKHRFFLLALRIALGGIFIYAGATKISNPQAFADSIATFQLLPNQLTNIVALALPPFEVLLGVILISGWKTRALSIASAGLSLVFVIALGQAIARGIVVDCGCFGSGEPSLAKTWMSFGRACLLLAASSWLYFRATLRL